jgi:pSer/pThr/pTyr-binding forkhead associated (FHA) protein
MAEEQERAGRFATGETATRRFAAHASRGLCLVVFGANAGDRVHALEDSIISIGRSPACDVAIPDPRVGEVHAWMFRRGAEWSIRDAGSGFGTSVNGERVCERVLALDDRIELGSSAVTLFFTDRCFD